MGCRRLDAVDVWMRTRMHSEPLQVETPRAITPKLYNKELWFLRNALLLNEIYLPMKFHVDTSYSFPVMANVKVSGQTHKHTDRHTQTRRQTRTGQKLYAPTIFDLGA